MTISPGVLAAIHLAGVRGEPCGATSPLSTCILYCCLQMVTIPEAVVMQLVLLRMNSVLLETC